MANGTFRVATLGGVDTTSNYWRDVGAPKVRERKAELGREVSNTTIAAAVEKSSGKNTSRQLVEEWFKGEREPYVSQLVALCEYLDLDPATVLVQEVKARSAGRRIKDGSVPRQHTSVRQKFRMNR